jgi:hypothetical protein
MGVELMKKNSIRYIKLSEDDVLRIVLAHYHDLQFTDYDSWGGIMLGTPGSDLRLIGAYGNVDIPISNIVDYAVLDKTIPFTGEDSIRERRFEREKENLRKNENLS